MLTLVVGVYLYMTYRFFINPQEINWQEKKAVISDPDHTYKISKVLRLQESDQIVLLDGNGLFYNAQITSFFSRKVQCRLLSRMSVSTEPNLRIAIAQSLLKGARFDYALQKNTEIGISEFIPIRCERTIIKITENNSSVRQDMEERIDRFENIVLNAAEQSERGVVPKVQNMMSLEELFKLNLASYDLKLFCLERSQTNSLKEVLNSIQTKIHTVLILIGPEGGFTDNESKLAISNDFTPVSLGKRIYRSETVGIIISSILFFYFNDLN